MKDAHDMGVGVFGMKALAGGHLCSSAAEAFDFVLDSGFIDAVAVGMQSEAEVDANIEYFEKRKFSHDAEIRLAAKKRSLHVEEYCEAEDFDSEYYRRLYKAGKVMALDLAGNFFSDQFARSIADGLSFLAHSEPPYCVHCTEGKDRAGFTVMLLAALMGAELEEIINGKEKKKTKWEKTKSFLIWLADKSFDVGMALLPLLLKI